MNIRMNIFEHFNIYIFFSIKITKKKKKNQFTDSFLWHTTLNTIQTVHVQKELTQFNLLIVRKNLRERETERKLFIHT